MSNSGPVKVAPGLPALSLYDLSFAGFLFRLAKEMLYGGALHGKVENASSLFKYGLYLLDTALFLRLM